MAPLIDSARPGVLTINSRYWRRVSAFWGIPHWAKRLLQVPVLSSIANRPLPLEKEQITSSLQKAFDESGFKVEREWGEEIEDRGSQITFSALGQQAPLVEKEKWDPDFAKRKKIKALLDPLIPGFSVRLGGATSIDVTKPGIDKAYGIRKLRDLLGISLKEMIYIGDALFPGGNDYPAEQAGVVSIPVRGPDDTKRVIETIIACLDGDQKA